MTDELESLRSALQAAERERDEAIAGRDAAIRRANAGHKATQERDAARLEAGRQMVERERDEARGQVALMADSMNKAAALAHDTHMGLIAERDAARADVAHMRSALELAAACMQNMTNWIPERSVGYFELLDGLKRAREALGK